MVRNYVCMTLAARPVQFQLSLLFSNKNVKKKKNKYDQNYIDNSFDYRKG